MKKQANSLRAQILRGALFGLVLAPTILIWLGVGSLFFGYRPIGIEGTSMKPSLLDGDELWVKFIDPTEAKAGDIVALQDPVLGRVAHRLVSIESSPDGSYVLVTMGDANYYAEEWIVEPGSKIGVAMARIRFVGHLFRFLETVPGTVLLVLGTVALAVVFWLARRRRLAHECGIETAMGCDKS